MLTGSDLVSMPEVTMDMDLNDCRSMTRGRRHQALSAGQPIVLEPEGIRYLNPRHGELGFSSRILPPPKSTL